MAPEYGATMGFFPVDAESVNYLRFTGRTEEQCAAFEAYFRAQEMFGMPDKGQIDYSVDLELNLADVQPSVAGPRRPQDRLDLPALGETFRQLMGRAPGEGGYGKDADGLRERFPVHLEADAKPTQKAVASASSAAAITEGGADASRWSPPLARRWPRPRWPGRAARWRSASSPPGPAAARRRGSQAHDEIESGPAGLRRRTGRSGGTEGGMSTGEVLRVRAAMKPIATVPRALRTIDTATGEAAVAHHQRSDVCAVPAAGVVAEAMVALVLADAALEKFGGDSVGETRRNCESYLADVERRGLRLADAGVR
jgi:hypothetical protein